MASYTLDRSKHATLAANVADVVTLAYRTQQVEVINRSTSPIYASCNSNDPTPVVEGDNTYLIQAGETVVLTPDYGADKIVRLVAAASAAYSIRGVVQ